MIKFPQIVPGNTEHGYLFFGNRPYARHNFMKEVTDGRKVGFLTENTFFFVIQGVKIFYFEDHQIKVDANHLLLLKKGIYTMSDYFADDEPFEALMIFVPDSFLKTVYEKNDTIKNTNGTAKPYVMISPNEMLNDFKIQYMSYFGKLIESMEALLQLKIRELFLLLISTGEKREILNFIANVVSTEPVDLDYLLNNYLLQPLSVTELANLSGRSLASFKRDFHAKFNLSPRQWINRQRLKHSKRALLNSNKQVAEIAHECGFESPSHFIRLFKKQYGFTPNRLRIEKAMI